MKSPRSITICLQEVLMSINRLTQIDLTAWVTRVKSSRNKWSVTF